MIHSMVDFFAGSGLVSVGFKGVCSSIWANDIDPIKAAIFNANHSTQITLQDVKKISDKDVPDADVFWGSFPCQDLSLAGNLGGIRASRSGLVWEWLRILRGKKTKPRLVIAENVYGLIASNEGQDYLSLHEEISSLGYDVGCVVLDAIHWLPQSRLRVFVIGVKKGVAPTDIIAEKPTWCHPPAVVGLALRAKRFIFWNLPHPKPRTVALEDIVDREYPIDSAFSAAALRLIDQRHLNKASLLLEKNPHYAFPGYRRTRNGQQKLELRFDAVAGCLRTARGGSSKQILVYKSHDKVVARFMTPTEAAKLMGVPSYYKLPGKSNDAYTAMGDAVAVPVVSFLANNIAKKVLDNVDKLSPRDLSSPISERARSSHKGKSRRSSYANTAV